MSQHGVIFIQTAMLVSQIFVKWCLLLGKKKTSKSESLHLSVTSYTQEKSLLFSETRKRFYSVKSELYLLYQQITRQKVSYQSQDVDKMQDLS